MACTIIDTLFAHLNKKCTNVDLHFSIEISNIRYLLSQYLCNPSPRLNLARFSDMLFIFLQLSILFLSSTHFIDLKIMTDNQVNQVSLNAYNSNHELYDQVRPDFPAAAVDGLVFDLMKLTAGKSRVLELASGTGKFTRALVDRGFCGSENATEDKHFLVAVEPSQGMIDSFQRNFPNNKPLVIKASAYDLASSSELLNLKNKNIWDAVIIAQAFHWFGTLAALAQFSKVLGPKGKLGLVWNYEDLVDLPATNWQVRVTEYVWSFDGDVPQYRRMNWIDAFTTDNQQYFELPYEEKTVRFELTMPRSSVWPYWASRSYITALPFDKQEEIRRTVEDIVYAKDIPESDKNENDDLIVRRATHVVCATKK